MPANGTSSDECPYYTCYLVPFSEAYDKIHILLSTTICVFGSISNIVNILVLTRKNMRTPINIFLTGLSMAQFLLGTNYLALMVFEYFRSRCYVFSWSYMATSYRLINVNFNVVFHTVAFAHTLAVALFRLLALKWPLRANRFLFCNTWALSSSLGIWIVVPFLCIPVFLTSHVAPASNRGCNFNGMYDLTYSEDSFMVSAVFWMFGIVLKLIPSLILAFLLAALIRSLETMEHRRQDTLHRKISVLRRCNNRPKTTHTLLAILILCFVVEFPHGILNLFTAIYGDKFGINIYDQLGSFMEMLTLLYSSISFILYCVTSNDFLRTFRNIFLKKKKRIDESSMKRNSRSVSNNNTRPIESMTLIAPKGPYPTIVLSRSM
ncbi:unnamed protein product [Bursaphelenchus okinawaensis]|uniref:G-protein coupled receptors family 1 profile domain-containing protein n=1 Tax=Bursaphelenchus okinawaensis TaxID=465554 RepID=A0A811KL04_9BILA|nr:unnamed protein product [Bursaphelenchus okinawaensis]CAG9106800.1 unnamed protein product [Bursaphelenchus okinawaensis]